MSQTDKPENEKKRTAMIKVEHLVKRYGGAAFALDDVSFEIGEGEIVGLLGPNGAGKSTAMNILTGYLSTTSGKAEIGGVDILENPIEAKRMIGYLPEQPPVYPDMTVTEYLRFVYELKGCKFPREQHLADVMAAVKITDVKARLIRNLSKGYRQRVGIAQALIGDPKVIIFDEPTVGLDPKQILEIRNLIRNLGRTHTVILSTHILAEVQSVCERIVIINHGRIIANERAEDLARVIEDNTHFRYAIVGDKNAVLDGLKGVQGVASVTPMNEREGDAFRYLVEGKRGTDVRRGVFRVCAERGWPILSLGAVGDDLESIFIRLVDRSDKEVVRQGKIAAKEPDRK